MYCKKCGSEIAPNEKVCGNCGEPVESPTPGKQTVTLTIPKQFRSPFGILYAVAGLFHLLQLIFWNINTISVGDNTVYTTAFVLKNGGETSLSFATVFFIILSVVSILLCAAPLLRNTLNKGRKMIVPLFTCVWTLIWIIVALNNDSVIGFISSISASFFGWLFIIVTVLTLLLEVAIVLLSNKIVSFALGKN